MSGIASQITYIRDWTDKSNFKNSLIDLMGTQFAYEERDKIDNILVQKYPYFQNETFPIVDSSNIELYRQLVFIEGVDFLFRAINFAQAIQKLLLDGYYSPAQSMSYQASFFCARAILGLSGIYCSEIKSKNFLFDAYKDTNEYNITNIKRNHQNMWDLLSQIIKLTLLDDSIIEAKLFNILKNVNYSNCSMLRHNIHYYNKYDFKDLFNRKEYDNYTIDAITANIINNNCGYFDLLCLFLILSSNLFLSIAVFSQGLEDMTIKYKKLLNRENNVLFFERLLFDKIKLYDSI